MDDAMREAYKRAGAIETTVQEWLGLNEIDREVIELRVRVAKELRRRREAAGMTQEEFATRIGTTRLIVDRIENGVRVSYDRLMNAYFAAGAKVDDLAPRRQVPSHP